MGKNVPLSEVQRAQIVTLHKEGYSERLISEKMKCGKSAVHNAVVKFQNTGSYSTRKKSGRPRKTTSRDDPVIRRIVVHSLMSSADKIRSALLAKATEISRSTVSWHLVDDFGLKAPKPVLKPRLTQAMKNKRLGFAKKHATCTKQQWSEVLFLDESTVQLFTTRKRYFRRPMGKRFHEKYTIQTMKHLPSVIIGGEVCQSMGQLDFFFSVEMTMNAQQYTDLLKSKYELHMMVHNCTGFMQYGAPGHHCHTVFKVVWLAWKQSGSEPNRKFMDSFEEQSFRKTTNQCKNVGTSHKEVWVREMPTKYCQSLVESMPKRLEAVIKAKRDPTKYWISAQVWR